MSREEGDGSGQPCHGRRAENATGYVCSAGKALRYLDWEETGCGRPGTRELLASLESGHGNGDDELVAAVAGEAVERGGSSL